MKASKARRYSFYDPNNLQRISIYTLKRTQEVLSIPIYFEDFFSSSHFLRSRLNSVSGKSIHGGPPQPQFAYKKGSRPLLEAWARAGFSKMVFAVVEGSLLPDFSALSTFSLPVAATLRASSSTSVSVDDLSDSVVAEEETDIFSESTGMVRMYLKIYLCERFGSCWGRELGMFWGRKGKMVWGRKLDGVERLTFICRTLSSGKGLKKSVILKPGLTEGSHWPIVLQSSRKFSPARGLERGGRSQWILTERSK